MSVTKVRYSKLAPYSDLFERLLDNVYLIDSETFEVLEANPAGERLLADSHEQILGKSIVQWITFPKAAEIQKSFRVSRRRYHPRMFETVWKTLDGNLHTMEVLACPLTLSSGKEVLQLIVRDITFRKEAEAKMQKMLDELQTVNAKLEQLTIMDEMTGLFNFRHFSACLEREHQRAQRIPTPYSIIFIDIDHFKKYNDRNGHPAGDKLLKEFGQILKKTAREVDVVSRYGGEEFAVICPGTESPGAVRAAERIREAIEKNPFEFGEFQPLGKVSASIGVSTYPGDGADSKTILKAADDALYAAKSLGRNRVCLFQEIAGKVPTKKTA